MVLAAGLISLIVGASASHILWDFLVDHRIDDAKIMREMTKRSGIQADGYMPDVYDEAGRRRLPWFWASSVLMYAGILIVLVKLGFFSS